MTQHITVADVAKMLGAQWEGNGDACVNAIADLQVATSNQISFLSKKQYEPYLQSTKAGAVIVAMDCEVPEPLTVIRVADPYLAYAKITPLFVRRKAGPVGIHKSAVVDETATVHPDAVIGPQCVVEAGAVIGQGTELQAGVFVGQNAVIGDNCLLYANVSVYHNVRLGHKVIVHSSTVLGSDGFGFSPSKDGWIKIHQLGGVQIGNNVEIGSGTSIDRGAVNDTVIGNGVIIDNQVHIAHNVKVGDFTAIAGCVGIAGSTVIGKHCTFGGCVAVNGHISIADNVHVNGGSIVTKSLMEAGQYASGTPLQDAKTWRKNAVRQGQLNEWVDRIKKLEQVKSGD